MNFDEITKLNSILEEKDNEIKALKQQLEYERALTNNQTTLYESILSHMPGNIYWLDKSNVYMGCNQLQAKNAALHSTKDIIGKTNYDLPWTDQAEKLDKLNTEVMETGIPYVVEEYAVMADGTSVYLSSKTPLRDKDNNIIGLLGVSLDITERKKMEVALKNAQQQAELASLLKSEFIANMSQTIRIPLNGIMELSQRLEQNLIKTDEKQYTIWIYQSCKQLLKLLNESFVYATANKPQDTVAELQTFDLRACIQDITQLLYPKIILHHIQLHIDIDASVPEHYITDAAKLHQALLTLLVNAIKNTKDGCIAIKVELVSQDAAYAQLLFSITDSGPGITPELESKLFNASPDKDSNQDLSLYLAQKQLGLLGSEIKVKHEENKGSMFYFTLSMKVA